jgi:hypothetical protein
MARWQDVVDSEPEFAAAVQALFDTRKHKTMATLRKDGSPRISGIECEFRDGEVVFGSMKGARKLDDLRRDPRLALHSPSVDPPEGQDPTAWPGDAKISGRAVDVTPEGSGSFAFRIDIREVALTRVGGMDHLVIQLWRPGAALKTMRNYN